MVNPVQAIWIRGLPVDACAGAGTIRDPDPAADTFGHAAAGRDSRSRYDQAEAAECDHESAAATAVRYAASRGAESAAAATSTTAAGSKPGSSTAGVPWHEWYEWDRRNGVVFTGNAVCGVGRGGNVKASSKDSTESGVRRTGLLNDDTKAISGNNGIVS